ncbi:hypothetical protein LTR09_005934 [Extremus antarcticus]|uniref:Uncharacterized protein n=1 Tax=Extremus antarcticus TaxID=702011 RepID=A0AAJ0GBW7_9PEZI|nr:hypothetical protein LTR09_005934 [Extremus antarcticus]
MTPYISRMLLQFEQGKHSILTSSHGLSVSTLYLFLPTSTSFWYADSKMKLLDFTFLLPLYILAGTANADCQYWDGTAPFCSGSCPSNCRTVQISNAGNGGSCWSGTKALCDCCAGPPPCTPTETETACYGFVLVCKNVQHIFGAAGDQTITCSSYACGACVGLPFFAQDDGIEPSISPRAMTITSTHREVIVRGRNTTEEEIEDTLVQEFGPKLSPDEMKNITAIRVAEPDVSLVRGSLACPVCEGTAMPEMGLRVQSPSPYYS